MSTSKETLQGAKELLTSRTVWFGIAILLGAVFDFSTQEQMDVANSLESLAQGLFAIGTIYYRKVATTRIK